MRIMTWVMGFFLLLFSIVCAARDQGQFLQVRTQFDSVIGKSSWLFVIRDLDHEQTLPYLFDMKRGENYWVVPTGGYDYLITISNLRMSVYQEKKNKYKKYEIKNFCRLESHGRIKHGKSAYITISGRLSQHGRDYRCHITFY
jgi:hypothetical protein